MADCTLTDGQQLEPQFRTLTITRDGINTEARTVDMSFSSEVEVDRYFGREVLIHGEGADLTRLNDGGAFLYEHDRTQQIGVVESARIDGGVGRATVRFSKSARADEVYQDIVDGIRTKISFGYRIKSAELVERDDERGDLYHVNEWSALEISTVSIPADNSVGVGRAEPGEGNPVAISQQQTNTSTMPTEPSAPVADPAEPTPTRSEPPAAPAAIPVDHSAVQREERERIREISAIGSRFGLGEDATQRAIEDGTELDAFRAQVIAGHKPAPASPEPAASLEIGLSSNETERFSIVSAIRGMSSGKGLQGLEAEVSNATADQLGLERGGNTLHIPLDIMGATGQRDLEAGTDSEGGYTVATDLGSMIDLLRNRLVTAQAGVQQLTGLQGNLALPKVDSGSTASWVDEEGAVSASAQVFGQVTMTPHRLSSQTVYSDQLIRQSSIGVEQFVRNDIMQSVATTLDLAVLHGSGTGAEPEGIANVTGINAVSFGAVSPTWAKVVEFETAIATDNADVDSMSYITSPGVVGAWKTTERATNTGLWLMDGMSANGYPVYRTNQVTGDIVFFGNFSDAICGTWGAMSVVLDPYSGAGTGQRKLTVSTFHDIACRNPVSFAVSSDAGNQ